MRYYSIELYGNSETMKENATIRLNDYDYDNPLGALNAYIYRNPIDGMGLVSYREEGGVIKAILIHDEKKEMFREAYESLLAVLKDVFGITKIKEEPKEITMRQCFDSFMEARRRGIGTRVRETLSDWFWDFFQWKERDHHKFTLKEYIISEEAPAKYEIYDEDFVKELANIEEHECAEGCNGNAIQYVVSGRSFETNSEMLKVLGYSLLKAKRINSRRITMITGIHPDAYKGISNLEDIIESSFGGIVAFDLSLRFGYDYHEYVMVCEYITNLFKQYRNKCTFVFTYNINSPGFSYNLLPEITKYAIPFTIREGSGDRKKAVEYLKSLIDASDLAQYVDQADEFMATMPEEVFSQTDVLEAYEKFEPWCINKNVLKAYSFNVNEEFTLDRDENGKSSYDRLQGMIGLEGVKKQIDEIIAANIIEKERKRVSGKNYELGTMHMVFGGNPGSAKTTVAKLFARIAKEKGILKSGSFVEKGGMDLIGPSAIRNAFLEAKGGVLFIDEAYALSGFYSVATLIQEMEEHREDVIVVLAGYTKSMESFMKKNEGLKSRIPYWVEFPDYSEEELLQIFNYMMEEKGFTATDDAVDEARCIFEKVRRVDDFGNGRYVRNLIERAVKNQSLRLMESKGDVEKIKKKDLFTLTKEDIEKSYDGKVDDERKVGEAKKELDEMIGLASVKEVINKALASFKMNKRLIAKGRKKDKASMHMVFTGNPGTAKTTVARLLAEILKDEKVLTTGKFVEAGRADLIGPFVGWTAPMVKSKFKEAKGGVLFIDEAYSLCDGQKGSFGDEAINTIVQEMENNREDSIVIFAGYPKPMQEFLERNPGMKSRVAFQIEFDDYTVDELCDITKLMVKNKDFTLTKKAMNKLRKNYEAVIGTTDYGNGRYVRKMLEEAEMNLAKRLIEVSDDEITDDIITTIEECDIPDVKAKEKEKKGRIGFIKDVA